MLDKFPVFPSKLSLLGAGIADMKLSGEWKSWEQEWEEKVDPLVRP